MHFNGSSNLERFWLKVFKVGFEGGGILFQVEWGLTKGYCSGGWKITKHIFGLVSTNHNKS